MTKSEETQKVYFGWLCEKIKRKNNIIHQQEDKTILSWLHEKEFYGIVPNDDNRTGDGIDLREMFLTETNRFQVDRFLIGRACTMLEMLIALALRMDWILFDFEAKGNDNPKWFWLLIKNLGFKPLLNDKQKKYNELILKKLLERTYPFDGKGGLFPLKRPEKDQRKVEIWYQMHYYIKENFRKEQ